MTEAIGRLVAIILLPLLVDRLCDMIEPHAAKVRRSHHRKNHEV